MLPAPKQCQGEHRGRVQRVKKKCTVSLGFGARMGMGKQLLELIGGADIVLSREAVSVESRCNPAARIEKTGHLRQVQVMLLCFRAACSNHSVRAELIGDLAVGIIGDRVGNRRNNGLIRTLKYSGFSPNRVRIEVVGEGRTLSQTVSQRECYMRTEPVPEIRC